jgi:demethylmenaquinone methyltransferase/2-methoxy-6-polyprenyl-1,4-benzoquinol methylase
MNPNPPAISPVPRPKSAAKAFYDRLSRWYDLLAGSSERKYRDLGLQALDTKPGESALEIGYGTGHSLLRLAQSVGQDGRVCGIDLSEGMRRVARARLESADLAERVELQIGDGADLPYKEDQFDAVFISFTLELFDTPEIPLVLTGCRRVLRPDGRLALVTMAKSEQPNLAERIYEWFHARWPAMVDCRPIFARQALEAVGFTIRSHTFLSMWGLPVEIILAVNE